MVFRPPAAESRGDALATRRSHRFIDDRSHVILSDPVGRRPPGGADSKSALVASIDSTRRFNSVTNRDDVEIAASIRVGFGIAPDNAGQWFRSGNKDVRIDVTTRRCGAFEGFVHVDIGGAHVATDHEHQRPAGRTDCRSIRDASSEPVARGEPHY